MWPESEERQALRAAVSTLARRHLVDSRERGGPLRYTGLWPALAEGGYAGVNVPEGDGGPGGTVADLAAVAEEVAAAGFPLLTLVVSPGVCAPLLMRHATLVQKERWLAGIGTGTIRMAFALTESEAGSNSHRIRTRLVPDGSGFVLNGAKQFISGVDEADAVLVVARYVDEHGNDDGFALVVVDPGAPGVLAETIPMHVEAAERQFLLTFDAVRVDEDCLIGLPGAPLSQMFDGLNPERIISAATCVGLGRYCLDKAVAYARHREVWGVPIGAHQGVAHPLAQAYVALEGARLLTARAADLHDGGAPCGSEANVAKLAAADAAAAALDAAVQTHGGNGLAEEYGLGHLWGIVRMYGIAPVSREMALNHVATHSLGLPRSY